MLLWSLLLLVNGMTCMVNETNAAASNEKSNLDNKTDYSGLCLHLPFTTRSSLFWLETPLRKVTESRRKHYDTFFNLNRFANCGRPEPFCATTIFRRTIGSKRFRQKILVSGQLVAETKGRRTFMPRRFVPRQMVAYTGGPHFVMCI